MPTKYTLLLNMGNAGWSETYYSDVTFNVDAASNKAKALAAVRMPLAIDNCRVVGYRVSDPEVVHQSWLGVDTVNIVGQNTTDSKRDVTNTAVICRAASDDGTFRRTVTLRGILDDWVEFDAQGNHTFVPELRRALDRFKDFVLAAPGSGQGAALSMRVLVRGGLNLKQEIASITKNTATGLAQVTGSGLLTPSDGATIRIKNTTFAGDGPAKINGLHKALVPSGISLPAKTFLVDKVFYDPEVDGAYSGGGIWQGQVHSYEPIARFFPLRFSSHKTGRPFFSQAGRRRKAK